MKRSQHNRGPIRAGLFSWMLVPILAAAGFAAATAGAASVPVPAVPDSAVVPGAPTVAPAPADTAAVVVDGTVLFTIRERLHTFSAAERARMIESRIRRLVGQPDAHPESIHVSEADGASEIVVGDIVLMTVTQRDAAALGRSRAETAEWYASTLRRTIGNLREQFSLRALLFGVGWTILATLLAGVALRILQVGHRRIEKLLVDWGRSLALRIRFRGLELLGPRQIVRAARKLAGTVRFVLTIAVLYAWTIVVLGSFALTRPYASRMTAQVLGTFADVAHGIAGYLPNLVFIAVIVTIAAYGLRIVRWFFDAVSRGDVSLPGFFPDWAEPTFQITRFLLVIFTLVVVFPYLPGSKSPAFQSISLFVGLLVSLGSSSAISHIISGTLLTYTRAFQVGDRVKIGDNVGDVVGKTLLTTHLRTIKNVEIAVPNALVLGTHIVNYSAAAREKGLILHATVTIGYDVPWRTVHELLIGAAAATPGIVADPAPFVLQTALDDSYVHYEINAVTREASVMVRTYSDLYQNIQDRFRDAGVEIMSPTYAALRDGNPTTIPGRAPAPDAPPRDVRPNVS